MNKEDLFHNILLQCIGEHPPYGWKPKRQPEAPKRPEIPEDFGRDTARYRNALSWVNHPQKSEYSEEMSQGDTAFYDFMVKNADYADAFYEWQNACIVLARANYPWELAKQIMEAEPK